MAEIHTEIFVEIIYIPFQVVAVYAAVLKQIFAGWPGRSADGSVLKHSPLSQTLPQLMENNSEYLKDMYDIVGDKALPLTQYLLTAYKDTKRWSGTRAQKSISVNKLMCTFHNIQFEGNSKLVVLYARNVFSFILRILRMNCCC